MFLLPALFFALTFCCMAQGRKRGRPFQPICDEFTIVKSGKYKDVICNHCRATLSRVQPSRALLSHVLRCPEIPAFLRELHKGSELKKSSTKQRQVESSSDEEDQNTSAPEYGESYKDRCRMAIALFVYRSGVAFRIVEHPAFRQMFSCICPAVMMPSRHQVAGELLDAAYLAERKSVIAKLKDQVCVALVSDGWSNPRRESLINFMVVAFIYSNQGLKAATAPINFDPVVDLASASESSSVSQSAVPCSPVLLRQIHELEAMAEGMKEDMMEPTSEWDFDGTHRGEGEYFAEDAVAQQTAYLAEQQNAAQTFCTV